MARLQLKIIKNLNIEKTSPHFLYRSIMQEKSEEKNKRQKRTQERKHIQKHISADKKQS